MAAAVLLVPHFASADDDTVPADKQAVVDGVSASFSDEPSAEASSNASADSGAAADVTAIKGSLIGLLNKYNRAQILSPDVTTRIQQAQAAQSDVTDAAPFGATKFSTDALTGGTKSGQTVTAFRQNMAAALDSTVVIEQSVDISDQLMTDATDPTLPSLVGSSFSLVQWQGAQVSGSTATAMFLATYTNCFNGADLTAEECDTSKVKQWTVALRKGADGVWRMTSFDGQTVDEVEVPATSPTPSPSVTTPTAEPTVIRTSKPVATIGDPNP